MRFVACLIVLVGCQPYRPAEDTETWFDPGSSLNVEEPIAFTETNYAFPTDPNDGIASFGDTVFPVAAWSTAFGPDDQWPTGSSCESVLENDLPAVIEGVVTLHPRWYFKTHGCDDGDEKFYGSFFIQDGTGGLFVLGDTKVAHFDMGDRVRLRVRGVRTIYDLNVIYAYDLEEVTYGPEPIYAAPTDASLTLDDVGLVRSVSGTVVTDSDTFGEFQIENDEGVRYTINIDADLSRRGFAFNPGDRITVRGPVLYSYSTFSILVIRVGQVLVEN